MSDLNTWKKEDEMLYFLRVATDIALTNNRMGKPGEYREKTYEYNGCQITVRVHPPMIWRQSVKQRKR